MRQVAERVGYTAPVVYEYFADKREPLLAVMTTGFADLADHLAAASHPGRTPAAGPSVEDAAATLWTFATANPRLYQLMHSLVDVPFGAVDTPAPARRCFQLLKAAVTDASPDHPAAAAQDEDAPIDLFWAHVHGLIVLALNGRIRGGHARARALLDQVAATIRDPRR